MPFPDLRRPPRHPYAWAWWFGALHVAVALLWWFAGWPTGVAALVATHLLLVWATLKPQSRLLSPVLTRLPTPENVVWLTIDDGPSEQTLAVLDLLDAHAARATFFVVGARAAQHPELVREMVRRGHGIANHSYTHPAAWFWALLPWRMRTEVARNQALLTQLTGTAPRWFRAVIGMANPFLAPALKSHGLTRVAWCARGFDAVVADPAHVLARVERGLAPGAIVLMHEGAPHGRNVETLALLLQRLDVLGYRTVLPEMLEAGRDDPAAVIPPPSPRSASC